MALQIRLGDMRPEELDSQQSDGGNEEVVAPVVQKRVTINWTDEKIKAVIDAAVLVDPSNKAKNKAEKSNELVKWAVIATQLTKNNHGPLYGSELTGDNLKSKMNSWYVDWQARYHDQGANKSGFTGDVNDKSNYTGPGSKPYDLNMKYWHDLKTNAATKNDESLTTQKEQLEKEKRGLQGSMLAFSSRNATLDGGSVTGSGGIGGNQPRRFRSSSPAVSETSMVSADPMATYMTELTKRKADEVKNRQELELKELELKKQKQEHDIEMARRQMALEERRLALEEARVRIEKP